MNIGIFPNYSIIKNVLKKKKKKKKKKKQKLVIHCLPQKTP